MTRLDSFPIAFVVGLVVLAGASVALAGGNTGSNAVFQSKSEAAGQQSSEAVTTGQQSQAVTSEQQSAEQVTSGSTDSEEGFLQSKSEATGEQSAEQVQNRLRAAVATGTNLSDGDVGVVRIRVRKAPGANNVDLSALTAQFAESERTFRLRAAKHGGDETFGIESVVDEDDSLPVLNDPDDRALLVIDLNENETGVDGPGSLPAQLEPGEVATVTLITKSGTETDVRLIVPDTLTGKSTVTL